MATSTDPTPPRDVRTGNDWPNRFPMPARRLPPRTWLAIVVFLALIGLGAALVRQASDQPGSAADSGSTASSPSAATASPSVPRASSGAGLAPTGGAPAGSPASSPGVSRVGGPVDRTSRTQDGAVAAAARYATLLQRMFPLPPEQARAVAADAAADSFRDRLVAGVDSSVVPLQQQAAAFPGKTTYRQAVLATKVTGIYIDAPGRPSGYGRARIDVWTLLTISQTGRTPNGDTANATGTFTTIALGLVWQRGAWRIEDLTELLGPTPLIDGTPATGQEFDHELQGFTAWPAP